MPTGEIRKWLPAGSRADGQAFGFIKPDDGISKDVFAPARTRKSYSSRGYEPQYGDKVEYEVKEDDQKGSPMAATWLILNERSIPRSSSSSGSSRSRSGSRSGSRSRSRSFSRSRSRSRKSASPEGRKGRHQSLPKKTSEGDLRHGRSRSPSKRHQRSQPSSKRPDEVSSRKPEGDLRHQQPSSLPSAPPSAQTSYKVTIYDIPAGMDAVELEYLAADCGAPVVSAVTYKSGTRHHGIVEFSYRADAEACILELNGKHMPGSELKLQCLHGVYATAEQLGLPPPQEPPRNGCDLQRGRSLDQQGGKVPNHGCDTSMPRVDHGLRSRPRNQGHSRSSRQHPKDRCSRDQRSDRRKGSKDRRKGSRHRSRTSRHDKSGRHSRGTERKDDGKTGDHFEHGVSTFVRPGDWPCRCGMNVFASKTHCPKCGLSKEDNKQMLHKGESSSTQVRLGDWECPKCRSNVFASKNKCFNCGEPKPRSTRSDNHPNRRCAEEPMTLFVHDVPDAATKDDVSEAFQRAFGEQAIMRVMLKIAKTSNLKSAFVRFGDAHAAEEALRDVKFKGIRICDTMINNAEMSRTNTSIHA